MPTPPVNRDGHGSCRQSVIDEDPTLIHSQPYKSIPLSSQVLFGSRHSRVADLYLIHQSTITQNRTVHSRIEDRAGQSRGYRLWTSRRCAARMTVTVSSSSKMS